MGAMDGDQQAPFATPIRCRKDCKWSKLQVYTDFEFADK